MKIILHLAGASTDNLPPGVLYKVKATYKYQAEDMDELAFEVGELIQVVEYDDPEEQVKFLNYPNIFSRDSDLTTIIVWSSVTNCIEFIYQLTLFNNQSVNQLSL